MECLLEWGVESFVETFINMNEIIEKLKAFMENEARSCSMDFGCITPLYVYRMWGGTVPLNEIEDALRVQDARFMVNA